MKAVRLENGAAVVVELADPRPGPDEALIAVTLAGICGTDLEIARGYLDFHGVPGHEFVGVVESAPDPGWLGARVVGEINAGCGACEACARGGGRHCPERTVLGIVGRDGAFAERLTLPLANLHRVPAALTDEVAVFTEPLAAAHRIIEQLDPKPKIRAVVLGDGRLGQLCAAVLCRAGSPPLVCGRHPKKLSRLERMGLETTRSPATLQRAFDLAVESTGSPEGLRTALSLVRPGGTIALKSTYHGEIRLDLSGVVIDEVRIVGSRCGPFAPALRLLADDPSVTDGMLDAVYPIDDARDAFEHAARPDALKILLAMRPR